MDERLKKLLEKCPIDNLRKSIGNLVQKAADLEKVEEELFEEKIFETPESEIIDTSLDILYNEMESVKKELKEFEKCRIEYESELEKEELKKMKFMLEETEIGLLDTTPISIEKALEEREEKNEE